MSIAKKLIRTSIVGGVIVGTLVGGTALLAGPQRSAAIYHQVTDHVVSMIDNNIEDPVALRAQLKNLENEYPEKISQLRGDLAELQEQIRQLERERAISERVVELASSDLEALGPELASAKSQSMRNGASLASVRFDSRVYTLDQAESRARQIRQTQVVYSNKASEASHDLIYLQQQHERIVEILDQLEGEYSQFQTQVWQLERQVDAIARNERLIKLVDRRQRTIDELSRFEVASLDHMVSRLSELRSRQEAELDVITSDQRRTDYESMARMHIGEETSGDLFYELESAPIQELVPLR